ncbi:MAG TPA: sugar ABC transporter substrate-binding protein [Thermomicrobiales bacterium]
MNGLNRTVDRRRLIKGASAAGVGLWSGTWFSRSTRASQTELSREYEGTTLNVLMEDLLETTLVEELLPEFEEQTGIKVQFEKVVYPVMHDKLVASLAAGEGGGIYDLLEVDFYWVYEFARAGWVEDLGERIANSNGAIDLSRYTESVLNIGSQVDGKTYYIPMYVYPMGLIYRKDLLEDQAFRDDYQAKAGKELALPTTVEEYVEQIKIIQQLRPDELYGAAMQGMQGDPIVMEFCNYLYGVGGDFYDAELTQPTINNELGVKAAELYIDAIKNAAQPGAANADLNDTGALWRQGRAFSAVSYLFLLSDGENLEESQVKGKGAVTTMPGGVGLTGSWSWGIPKSSPNPDAAWEFIKWVESPDIAMRRALGGGVAAQKAPYDNPEYTSKYPWMAQVRDLIATSKGLPGVTKQATLVEIVGRHLSDAVAGGKSAQEAMDAAAEELSDLL